MDDYTYWNGHKLLARAWDEDGRPVVYQCERPGCGLTKRIGVMDLPAGRCRGVGSPYNNASATTIGCNAKGSA